LIIGGSTLGDGAGAIGDAASTRESVGRGSPPATSSVVPAAPPIGTDVAAGATLPAVGVTPEPVDMISAITTT
jgi:hypothetical protein